MKTTAVVAARWRKSLVVGNPFGDSIGTGRLNARRSLLVERRSLWSRLGRAVLFLICASVVGSSLQYA
jgi:hypothetical protein